MSTTKVRLLNDGGYSGFENVTFPAEVKVEIVEKDTINVPASELELIGFNSSRYPKGLHFIEDEFEVIE